MTSQNDFLPYPKGFATAAVHHGQEPEEWDSMAIVAPIVTSATFKQFAPAQPKKFEYGRSGNPTREVLEKVLAKLNNAKYGLAFSSGMGATSAVLGLLNAGDQIIIGNHLYGGTRLLFNRVATKFGIKVTFLDMSDLPTFEKNINENTKVIWIETPTNPTMQVVDIKAVSEITKRHNIILVFDNTFLTPYLLQPMQFGVDIFLAMGNVPSPFDCYQVNRGLKTLALRMEKHKENALLVAKYLENHPKVEKVLHPGLPSHPQHDLFKQQTSGHSGTFSFYLKGDLETSKKFLTAVKLVALAGSLGGCESLIELPCVLSQASLTPEQRKVLGVTESLIRISVGIEDVEDIIADLEQAFKSL
ncbi:hypothetical protein ABEB36_010273 [Hypothenemus hampei]|uniref:cystathionine gamma-lyase n=1 Tax=Hypothenemus hampei TaxID=57062 RepID=A0ABD1EJP3_HYPHA